MIITELRRTRLGRRVLLIMCALYAVGVANDVTLILYCTGVFGKI